MPTAANPTPFPVEIVNEPAAFDFASTLSPLALAVSIAALLYSFYSGGPRLVVDFHVVKQSESEQWHNRGVMLTLFNVGRQALAVPRVGVGEPGGEGIRQLAVGKESLTGTSNPSFPLVVEPGHSVQLWMDDVIEVGHEAKVIYLTRNWLLRPVQRVWRKKLTEDYVVGPWEHPSAKNAG